MQHRAQERLNHDVDRLLEVTDNTRLSQTNAAKLLGSIIVTGKGGELRYNIPRQMLKATGVKEEPWQHAADVGLVKEVTINEQPHYSVRTCLYLEEEEIQNNLLAKLEKLSGTRYDQARDTATRYNTAGKVSAARG